MKPSESYSQIFFKRYNSAIISLQKHKTKQIIKTKKGWG
ncbi:unnamed protein product [Paramecium pentaurelia]|uniref:Uncharacterized protein n=1 Tax=Paramecium pentaurelia TaxID=43138 RepID=A0A8S1YBJ3_9CILI|nr:unnamed protein product [Paramecium pentaurelia]